MARRQTQYERRTNTKLGWWGSIAVLAVLAWQSGRLQLWLLPLLAWVLYELCYCPTICGVQTVRGHPCRNPTSGRIYSCKAQPAHRPLKNDALLRLLGLRHGSAPPPSAPQAHMPLPAPPPPEPASVEPRQQAMLYLTVAGLFIALAQTIWTMTH